MHDNNNKFDQLAQERIVQQLCMLGIRRHPLTWETVKRWAKQFDEGHERTLAWLILRNLIFRTTDQLESALRQALKAALQHFGRQLPGFEEVPWRAILSDTAGKLTISCGPPAADLWSLPGKSGDLIARIVNRVFRIPKYYPRDICTLQEDERFLIVDDGTFTGLQLIEFLDHTPRLTSALGKIGIVVALAHTNAVRAMEQSHPGISIFAGEHLTETHCFTALSNNWVETGKWPYTDVTPLEVYMSICEKHGLEDKSMNSLGFGGLGVMVAYEHGVPDDSLRLLWDSSPTWSALIER